MALMKGKRAELCAAVPMGMSDFTIANWSFAARKTGQSIRKSLAIARSPDSTHVAFKSR